MSTVETLEPEVIAAEPEVGAAPVIVVTGPVHIHPIKVGGQNAHASLRTDHLGNRLDFHAQAATRKAIRVTTNSSWSEAAIAILVKTTSRTTARGARVKLYCGWLGIANVKLGGLISGRGRWRAEIEAGLCKASDVTHPLIKNRLLAKAGGGWDVAPATGDAAVTLVDFDHLPAAERSHLMALDRAFRDIKKPYNALNANLKERWLGTVTFPAVTLEPDTKYEIFLKAKSEGEARASFLSSALAYVDFNPSFVHPDLDDVQVRRDYGLFLNAAEIQWRRPGVESFDSNGDLINDWYWLRRPGARADWMFQDVDKAQVTNQQLWATLKPMVVTTTNGTPTSTEIGISIGTGKLQVKHGKPTRFAVPMDKITTHGRVPISITWSGEDANGDGLPEHVAVNAEALTLDYD